MMLRFVATIAVAILVFQFIDVTDGKNSDLRGSEDNEFNLLNEQGEGFAAGTERVIEVKDDKTKVKPAATVHQDGFIKRFFKRIWSIVSWPFKEAYVWFKIKRTSAKVAKTKSLKIPN
ncbi:uncharacterized protein LOC128990871 [Macrosteles quadrilineatus]|uniref:uncharacterized protein LOC128990871 n=1 Tax=Macrosteles quadrilineatus TaxID=74068 RepID=UPI0023E239BA|nr:uncharacterized protein LOC128990871 [Macrosteles quadrilineatus]